MIDKDNVSKKISSDKIEEEQPKVKSPEQLEKEIKIREGILFEQPPSDSEYDICGPLDCDKQL
jgi:hypothetical protein